MKRKKVAPGSPICLLPKANQIDATIPFLLVPTWNIHVQRYALWMLDLSTILTDVVIPSTSSALDINRVCDPSILVQAFKLYISVTLHVTHISSISDDSIHIPLPDHSEPTCHLIKRPGSDICTLWHWMIVLEETYPQQHGTV